MTEEIQLRTATREDVPALLALERRTDTAPHWPEGVYLSAIEDERRRVVVAFVRSEMAGFGVGHRFGDEAEIESVAVEAGLRRRGLGRGLMDDLMWWCRAEGVQRVELEVRAGSAGAQALYQGCGFEEVGRRRHYYREPEEDAVLMRWGMEGQGGNEGEV